MTAFFFFWDSLGIPKLEIALSSDRLCRGKRKNPKEEKYEFLLITVHIKK